MTKVSRADVTSIARISHIDVHGNELDPMVLQLDEVLTYTARVSQLAHLQVMPSKKNINVYRTDTVHPSDPTPLRARMPEREGNYFTVPIIIDQVELQSREKHV